MGVNAARIRAGSIRLGMTRMGWKWDWNLWGGILFCPKPNLDCCFQFWLGRNGIDDYEKNLYIYSALNFEFWAIAVWAHLNVIDTAHSGYYENLWDCLVYLN